MTTKATSQLLLLLSIIVALLAQLPGTSCHGSSNSHQEPAPTIGYLLYCPCMGRFGNQAEQFLGVLAFARSLRRTLVVPPWISYAPARLGGGIRLAPFTRHFNLTALAAGHPAIAMEQFMAKLAPTVWPPGSRTVYCHSPRGSDGTCQAKVGSPFGPFWDAFGVAFDREEFYAAAVGTSSLADGAAWTRRYPGNRYPVLAFMGAPASFPARPEHVPLHSRHVVFADNFTASIERLMATWKMQRPILGIHLRNNVDFTGACASLVGRLPPGAGLFSSYQCFGHGGGLGQLTMATCSPDDATIAADARRVAAAVGARTVFVASDYDGRRDLLASATTLPDGQQPPPLVLTTGDLGSDVFQDVALLSAADAVLLNCASSLSAFVRRMRDARGLPTGYLGLGGAPGWSSHSDEL